MSDGDDDSLAAAVWALAVKLELAEGAVDNQRRANRRFRWLAAFVFLLPFGGIWYTARGSCRATNSATHKVTVVVDTLAADTRYPKGASAALRTAIDNGNRQRKTARELTEHLLAPEGC